ncbi:sel1 repeat family protein [Pelomyxa schiedti]|nr:sel1 repeat family protein [Pelomyxa schiedti]
MRKFVVEGESDAPVAPQKLADEIMGVAASHNAEKGAVDAAPWVEREGKCGHLVPRCNCGGAQVHMADDYNEGGEGACLAIVTSLGLGDFDSTYHSCLDLLASSSSPSPSQSQCGAPPPTSASGMGHKWFDLNRLLASTIDPINTYVDADNDESEFRCECTCCGGGGGGKWRALALLVLRSLYNWKPSLFKEYRPHLVFPSEGLRIAVKNSSTESLRILKGVLDTACLNKPRLDVDTAGMTQEEKRKYEEAKAMWCAGTYLRGVCLFHGIGTPEDKSGALLLDLECEPYGFGPSLFNIGWCYEEGKGGVERDFAKARQFHLSAAEKGHAGSQVSLALMCKEGRGAGKNLEEAVRLFQKNCEQESVYGYSNLALCFKFGRGVNQDEAEATRLLKLAVEQGDPWSQRKLGLQASVGPTESLRLFRLAAAQGDTLAQRELAKALLTGQGTTSHLPNPTLAVKFYKLAADKGDRTAQEHLGLMYFEGAGEEVPEQHHLAVKYFRQAANAGSLMAQNNLALCYNRGYGVPVDLREAFRLYTLSATSGDRTAQFNVALCYVMKEGAGTTRDVREALRWFRLAADQNQTTSVTVMKRVRTGTDLLTALRIHSST